MSDRKFCSAILLLSAFVTVGSTAAPLPQQRMSVVSGKDVSGGIYKKVGLPNRQYCWDACLKEERCSGVRWGVVEGDVAGLCVLLAGPLTFHELAEPKTEDGKAIHITAARKDSDSGARTD